MGQDNTYTSGEVYGIITDLKGDRENKIASYQKEVLNTYTTLYNKLKSENERLKATDDKNKNHHSTDGQQSKYVNQSASILSTIYFYMFWIYIALGLVLCVFIYLQPFSIIMKIVYFIIILGFPFYIYILENLFYNVSIYLYKIIISVAYTNGFSDTNIEYGQQAMHEIIKTTTIKSPPLDITKMNPLDNLNFRRPN